MYILPNATDFNNACASVDRSIATKCDVVSGGITRTMVGDGINGEIISMEWDNIVCSNDGLQIGTTCMDEFKMTYRPISITTPLMGRELHPYVGLDINGQVTYVPLGIFYVTNAETQDDGYTINITAYDGMQRFMDTFDASAIGVTFPCRAWDLLSAIATYFGVTISYSNDVVFDLLSSDDYFLHTSDNYGLEVPDNLTSNKYSTFSAPVDGTYRDYIGWVAGLVGAFAHMGRNGDLVINLYNDYGFTVDRNVQHMGGAKINYGGSVAYTSIISGTDENPIYPTNYSGNAITYSNPYITQKELDKLCDGLLQGGNITVTPCDVTWRSNPCIDAGDIVTVEDRNGNSLPVYVMERVVRVTGGLAEELHCYGETEIAHTLNKSPLETKLTQVATAPISADRIQAGTLGGDVVYNGTISADNITSGTLRSDIIYSGTVSADNITAGTIGADVIYGGTVDADHINAGTLGVGVIYAGDIDASQITSGTIDASLINVTNLDADNITSGTIDASVIGVTNIDASNITTGYLSGSVIQAGTITANMLDTAYAEIDLANVVLTSGEAIVTNTGYINNATINDLTTNGLRVLGKDGLYYAINVDGGAVSAQTADADLATYGTQITGETIIDGTVTAQKIYVTDLYALNATIGGLKIASGSIYSGTKTSLDTGIGLYMDSTGQLGLVGANGYLKFYDDNGSRKLSIVADSLFLGSTDVENLEYTVEIQVTAIDYDQNTATLSAQPYKNGATQTASSFTYTWVKVKNGTRTTLATTTSQLSVTDLDAIYEVVVN